MGMRHDSPWPVRRGLGQGDLDTAEEGGRQGKIDGLDVAAPVGLGEAVIQLVNPLRGLCLQCAASTGQTDPHQSPTERESRGESCELPTAALFR